MDSAGSDRLTSLLRSPGERPVLAAADNIIAAICGLTHNRPASACAGIDSLLGRIGCFGRPRGGKVLSGIRVAH
jgi:hypothetical protein